jgi:hypothetical protein
MKDKAVSHVFKKGPEKHTAEKNQQDGLSGKIIRGGCIINQKAEDGDIHTPNNQRVGLGQGFQEIVFKKTGLAFVMNFFKMHEAKIGNEAAEGSLATG